MSSVYIENESLSKYCTKVFGSVFKKAFLEVYFYETPPEDYDRETLIENSKNLDFSNGQYDTRTIVIEFSNGSIVEFTNSEWASFENVELANLNILEQETYKNGN